MATTHIRDGEDFFSPVHEQMHQAFGFRGSAESSRPTRQRGGKPPFAGNEPTRGPSRIPEPEEFGEQPPGDYATGGQVHHHPHGHHVVRSERHASGGIVHHHAHGGMSIEHPDGHMTHHHHDGSPVHHAARGGEMTHVHPHGHHVVHVEHHADGRIVHHHEHGGHTVHHVDGRITHHHEDGAPVHAGAVHHGVEGHHDTESEYVHRARGGRMAEGGHAKHRDGDLAQDKAMIKKAFRQHENAEHHGEHEDLTLARGGLAGHRVSLPRGMKPEVARHHSPIDMPPRNPNLTTTPRNQMSGGVMPYGVEPSAEPDQAGAGQGIPQLRRGGRA